MLLQLGWIVAHRRDTKAENRVRPRLLKILSHRVTFLAEILACAKWEKTDVSVSDIVAHRLFANRTFDKIHFWIIGGIDAERAN